MKRRICSVWCVVAALTACGGAQPPAPAMGSDLREASKTAAQPSHPAGTWFMAGSMPTAYQGSGDPTGAGPDSLTLSSTTAPAGEFGTMMSFIAAAPHLGKRVRLSATVRTETVHGWAGLWLRVDGQSTRPLAFDNMSNRPLTGTTGAAEYSIVLDVSDKATNIAYGVLLDGQGLVTVSGLRLEDVDASVPVTTPWFLTGSAPDRYEMHGDPTGADPKSLTLTSIARAGDFGTAMTEGDASPYAGKRVRLSATLQTTNVAGWAGLWMRVDGKGDEVLAFDNMEDRPLRGTLAAASYQVVLDVPTGAVNLAYGALLDGSGELDVSRLKIEVVDSTVPTTN